MRQTLEKHLTVINLFKVPLENIQIGDIIKDPDGSGRDRLILVKDNEKLRTVSWLLGPPPQDLLREEYEIIKTKKNFTILYCNENYISHPGTKTYCILSSGLKSAGIKP